MIHQQQSTSHPNPATTIPSDVIIVGGGPAGAAMAIWLAEEGMEVTLLDRARFPRDKACGEFLTPQAARLLRQLGVWERLLQSGLRSVAATLLCAPDGRRVRHTPLDGNPAGYTVRRVVLDDLLLQRARACGVTVREGFAVRSISRDATGRVIGVIGSDLASHRTVVKESNGVSDSGNGRGDELLELRARMIVGADGSHSLVARQLELSQPIPRLQRLALVAHWQGVEAGGATDAIEMRSHGALVCGMGFPGANGDRNTLCANTTFVLPNRMASRLAGRKADWIDETLQTCFPDLASRLAGATREAEIRTIGCFGHRSRSVIADGALLVGDAATFIDPFTGEGVYFSLRGAQLAAEVAVEALRRGDTSRHGLRHYTAARNELNRRYLLIDLVQTVVRTPSLFNEMVRRLERFPGATDRLLNILGDTRPATDVLHPGLLWRLFAPCA